MGCMGWKLRMNAYICMIKCQDMMYQEEDEDEEQGKEYLRRLMSGISSGTVKYLDVKEIRGGYYYLVSEGRRGEAYRLLELGLAEHPDNGDLLLVRATQYVMESDFDRLRSLLGYLRERCENTAEFQYCEGYITAFFDSDFERGFEMFSRAVELADEEEVLSYVMNIAGNYADFQLFDDAISFYECLTEEALYSDSQLAFNYAYALDKAEREDDALKAYKKIVKRDVWNANAWNNLGIAYAKREEMDKAKEAYMKSADINPNSPNPYYNMGDAMRIEEKNIEAIDYYTEYVSLVALNEGVGYLRELDCTVFQKIGDCWAMEGRFDLAVRFFEMTVEKWGAKWDSAWYLLGRCYVAMGENDKALGALQKSIELKGDVADYYYSLAQAWLNLGNEDSCLECLERGLSVSPDDVLAWFEVVRMRLCKLGEGEYSKILDYIRNNKIQYDSPAGLEIVEAYVNAFVFEEEGVAAELVKGVAKRKPEIIVEALREPTLSKLFEDKKIGKILDKYKIKH